MTFGQGFIAVTLVHLMVAASPGPDFAYVTRQALVHGRRAGMLASLGIALGLSVHLAYSIFGLAAVFAHSNVLLRMLRYAAGGYLCYLGYRGLSAKAALPSALASGAQPAQTETAPASVARQIGGGFFCNALNPKGPPYFLSLFTIVLSPSTPMPTLAAYGLWLMIVHLAWFSFVTWFLSQGPVRRRFLAMGHWLDRTLGGVMLALGLGLLWTAIK